MADALAGQLGVAIYNGGQYDSAADIVISPDGSKVYVTGYSGSYEPGGDYPNYDYATVAYDVSTGSQAWVARYDGGGICCTGNAVDQATDMVLSPDGTRLYVTGYSEGSVSAYRDFATIAYDTSTGGQVWVARYNGPINRDDRAAAIAVSPDGSRVYVTGSSENYSSFRISYSTVAYDTATGSQVWARRYNGPHEPYNIDHPYAIAASPDGSRVFVTGDSEGTTSGGAATVAYNASTGAQAWVARCACPIGNVLAVSPDGSRVYAGGEAVVAYAASTGSQVWTGVYGGQANAIAVSPDGTRLYVTGAFRDPNDFGTVAFDASTGSQVWVARYDGQAHESDHADDIALSPNGSILYVTGGINDGDYPGPRIDYGTVAYRASTGAQLAAARFGTSRSVDSASALAVSPDGSRVYVTGQTDLLSGDAGTDVATVVYGIG